MNPHNFEETTFLATLERVTENVDTECGGSFSLATIREDSKRLLHFHQLESGNVQQWASFWVLSALEWWHRCSTADASNAQRSWAQIAIR
jgi:hypothetical protein